MPNKTDNERYDQALAYIATINVALSTQINTYIDINKAAVGAELSLAGSGYWKSGSTAQHIAVRALLLCHIAYFRQPHAKMDYASPFMLDITRRWCVGKSLAAITGEIRLYLPAADPKLTDLADAAIRINEVIGVVERIERKRTDTNVSTNPICYDGVVSWLFSAGFISKRWLAKEANDMHASKVNGYLGNGLVVPKEEWGNIPLGYIWNIHREGDKTTCHWGVSLGDGQALACNNTDESNFKKLAYINGPSGRPGDTKYGRFLLADICEVLNGTLKYGHVGPLAPIGTNIVVRKINPTAIDTYY